MMHALAVPVPDAEVFGGKALLKIRLLFLVLIYLGSLPFLSDLAHAESDHPPADQVRRIALVIGNGAYTGGGVLANPANDATDMADKLTQLGFKVTLRTDADYMVMRRALTEFGRQVTPGTVALFFFAGHGMQVRGRNYLLPVDARIQIENDVGTEAMDADFVLDKLSQASLSIVILDACRNNPFERRFRSGSGAGLAHMAAPTGALIAYATAPGKVAADGEGRNGLYTGELLKALSLAGLQVEDVFKRVRTNVIKLSGDAQTPWEASSLIGSFYFVPASEQPSAVIPPAPPQAVAKPVAVAAVTAGQVQGSEDDIWTQAKQGNSVAGYSRYMKLFPAGNHIGQAKASLARLKRAEAELELGKVFQDCTACPEMVVIPGGHFEMGSGHGANSERAVHNVSIIGAYALGRTEVTQSQWRAIMGSNPSRFSGCGANCPVENVSWDEVQIFLQKLNAATGRQYRLPTEAEWEYAARAGSTSKYSWGDEVGVDNANCDGCGSRWDNRSTAPVASFRPNRFGIYDMHGNVSEWVGDCWNENYEGAPDDGSAWVYDGCSDHVHRGGNWGQNPRFMRSASRNWGTSGKHLDTRGFRLARTYKRSVE